MSNDSTKNFVHLHVHTEYSLLDGATRISSLFKYAGELGQSAVAITDHGNMYGVLQFCKAAAKHTDPSADFYDFMKERRPFKVKPIIGCELYMCHDMDIKESVAGKAPKLEHIVLLAKNATGYKNLIRLVSLAHTRGYYYKPRIDMATLQTYTEGLICLSACLAGAVPQAIMAGDLKKADAIAKQFKGLFGDDYYIELQDHNLREQKQVIPHLIRVARDNNIKLVATNDVHYLKREDWAMQKVLQCISFRKTLQPEELYDELPASEIATAADDISSEGSYFPTREFYLKSRAEMEEIFSFCLDALDNTQEIADKCDCYYFEKKPLLPEYVPDTGEAPAAMLRRLTYEGLQRNYKTISEEAKTRADYELGLIERLGFVDYFLIVWDFIHYAVQNGIPVGPGRGSGVGSIVAFALGITRPDPLKYRLIFERFLNPDRVSNPDFDIDFCVDRREEVIQYVVDKYGAENVSQIITFGSLKSKAALKDVGRVFNHPYSEMDKLTKLFPPLSNASLSELVGLTPSGAIPDLKAVYEQDETARRIFDMAIKVERFPRQTGIHAAGVIICKDPTYQHIPMAVAKKDKSNEFLTTTQFDMNECEQLGLLKMDFLGLRTLTDIQNAIDIITKTRGDTIDFYAMEYDDQGVFDLIGEGDTHAVFQLESEGMKRFMRDLKPTCLEDIIAGVALYRPGPMDNIPKFCSGKRDNKNIVYDHAMLENILDVTYGVMVYQEQVIQAAQKLAGYTVSAGDELRAMISKKKIHLFDAERKNFIHGNTKKNIAGAIKNGVPEAIANKIFDDIIKFGNYAFNKSHATAYAYLAYQTAYLKRYYTVEFITAVLNNRITSIDDIANYLRYLKTRNIAVLPPNINKSEATFSVEDGNVRIGLAAIKNVGLGVINEIIAVREKNGDFKDFENFITRMSHVTLNKRLLESLIWTGTFDNFGKTRLQLMHVYEIALARAAKDREAAASGQLNFFETSGIAEQNRIVYPNVGEYSLAEKLQYEKEVSGVYLTGHPLDEYTDFLKGFTYNTSHFAQSSSGSDDIEDDGSLIEESSSALSDGQNISLGGVLVEAQKRFTKTGKELGIGKLEDFNGIVEILASSYILNKHKDLFIPNKLVTLKGKVNFRNETPSFWVDEILAVGANQSSATNLKQRKICFYCDKQNETLLDALQEILLAYPGLDETFIKSTHDNKVYPLELPVSINDAFLAEIQGLLGENALKIV